MEKTYKININKEMEVLLQDVDKNFEQIIEINKPLIYYTISKVNYHPPITIDELFQESTIELWRICKKYKKISVSFSAYFVRDLKNYLINYVRRNQYVLTISYYELRGDSGKKFDDFAPLLSGKGGLENIDDVESNYSIEKTLFEFEDDRITHLKENLTKDEWNMIYSILVDGDSFAEYGRQTGITRHTARKRWIKLQKKIDELK